MRGARPTAGDSPRVCPPVHPRMRYIDGRRHDQPVSGSIRRNVARTSSPHLDLALGVLDQLAGVIANVSGDITWVPNAATGPSDATILAVLRGLGFRRAEAAGSEIDGLETETEALRVRGKGLWDRLAHPGTNGVAAASGTTSQPFRPSGGSGCVTAPPALCGGRNAGGLSSPSFTPSEAGTRQRPQARRSFRSSN